MHKKVLEFINANEALINANEWEQLYQKAGKELDSLTGLFTDALYEADIDPLEHLKFVPEAFGFGGTKTEFIIPEGVKSISVDAFGDCKVKKITLPNSLVKIDKEGIAYCPELEEITIPDNVIQIGEGAFESCKKLRSINIPSKLKEIEEVVFNRCIALNTVDMSNAESLERIDDRAFQGCSNLDELFIPPSVTYIANKALPDHTDILCKENSYAHEWAIAKDRHFKLV